MIRPRISSGANWDLKYAAGMGFRLDLGDKGLKECHRALLDLLPRSFLMSKVVNRAVMIRSVEKILAAMYSTTRVNMEMYPMLLRTRA